MEKNPNKEKIRKAFHLKKHKKTDESRSPHPRSTNREGNDEKPVLFQLGSIASYGVSDVRLKADPETTTSRSASLSLSSLSPTSSGDILEVNAKESFDSSRHSKELVNISFILCELQGSSDTPWSQVSGVTHASVEPALLSPAVQMMDREGSDQSQRNSSPTLEKILSTVSNDSLFSLSIGNNVIERDELFSHRDFKAGALLKSEELLSSSSSVHISTDSLDQGKSFDMEDKASEESELRTDSGDNASWRNIGDCNNSDEAPSSTQSFSIPITKKNKKKKKRTTKNKLTQQQQQKRRCSWLCCKNTEPCFTCCYRWPSCDYYFLCKQLKCCSCCCSSCA